MNSTTAGTARAWRKTNVPNLYVHRNGGYYYRVTVGGKPLWESLHTKLKSVAEARANEKHRIVKASKKTIKALQTGKLMVGDAIAVALEEIDQNPDLKPSTKHFRRKASIALLKSWPELQKLDPRKLTSHQVKEWSHRVRTATTPHVPYGARRPMRTSKGCSTSKHNSMLDVIRLALDVAVREGAAFSNVARHDSITRPAQKPKALILPNRADFPKLIAGMRAVKGNSMLAADLCEFLAYSGARKNEAKHVLWSDVDFERNLILLRETKNSEPRRVPMIAELRKLLETIKDSRPFDKPDSPVLAVNEAQKSIDSAARRVGISRLTHHDLRHLFAATLIEHGIDIPTAARLLGHKDGGALAMRTYGHLRDEHAQKVMARVSYSDQAIPNLVPMAAASGKAV
ncbi:MAG: site-specific integrase [Terrimicrobiaceae bacterium]